MATATKTLNPLHFEDLEPHRFEDLARQLVYDFRNWATLEAVGRLGKDEGIDIRAIERLADTTSVEESENFEDEVSRNTFVERIWIIQCKREKSITPKKIKKIVESDLSQQEQVPYAYMLVAACDFSKTTRDVFRSTVLSFGVQEFHIWGKAEIEDLLFQPKNDHLLFAYFGISLQVRQRSMKTDLRSNLSLKKKLVKELGDIRKTHFQEILLRNPTDKNYPLVDKSINAENLWWRYWRFCKFFPVDCLAFIGRRLFAYLDWNTREWDIIEDSLEIGWVYHPNLYDAPKISNNKNHRKYFNFFDKKVSKNNQAYYYELKIIPFERILAFDEIGDVINEPPHLLVFPRENGNPFEDKSIYAVEHQNRFLVVNKESRIKFFPSEIPEIEEALIPKDSNSS